MHGFNCRIAVACIDGGNDTGKPCFIGGAITTHFDCHVFFFGRRGLLLQSNHGGIDDFGIASDALQTLGAHGRIGLNEQTQGDHGIFANGTVELM